MRIRALVAAPLVAALWAAPLFAKTSTDVPEPVQPHLNLPQQSMTVLLPTEGFGHLAVDAVKQRANDMVYMAANVGAATKSDAVIEANVAQLQAEAAANNLNTQFYGGILIFAAGCLMWLGLLQQRKA